MPVIVGIDVGSRRCGCVAATEALPLHILIADVVHVPAVTKGRGLDARFIVEEIQAVVDELVERVLACNATHVVIEHGAFYSPATATPQQAAAMAQAHEICSHIEAGLYRDLAAHPSVAIETITRARWAHRVVPHTPGGIPDEKANAGLQANITPGSWEQWLCGEEDRERQDMRDAAGAIVGWLLPAPKKVRKSRRRRGGAPVEPETPEQKAEGKARRQREALERVLTERAREEHKRVEAGCFCFLGRMRGGGRHRGPGPAGASRAVGDEVVRATEPIGEHGLVVDVNEKSRRAVVEWEDGDVDVLAFADICEAGCRLAPAPMVRGDVAAAVAHGSWLR